MRATGTGACKRLTGSVLGTVLKSVPVALLCACHAALHHPVAHLVWHEKSPLAAVSPSLIWIMGTMCTVADQESPTGHLCKESCVERPAGGRVLIRGVLGFTNKGQCAVSASW